MGFSIEFLVQIDESSRSTDGSDGLAWVSFFSAISVDHKGEILGVGASRYPRRLKRTGGFFQRKKEISP